ncbi:MAG: HNH endonuclease signature motif containing protein, partial [Actinomycetota bacterium]
CTAPGCDRPPAACHAHHLRHWADGGPTTLANGTLLCRHHHQQIHRHGWTITLAPNGYPQFHPPPTLDPTGTPRQHHRFALQELGRNRN